MKKLMLLLLVLPVFAFAAKTPVLNQISLQLSAEQWATTQTANVTVSVDASLDKIGLANAQQTIIRQLTKIANGVDWHIVVFNRSQDQSGLEKLRVEAEARVPEKQLSGLRSKAKDISRPGETYRVANIDFSPSQQEIANTKAVVRAKIYAKAKQEIATLNKSFPSAQYFLHSINFGPMMMPRAQTKNVMTMAVQGSGGLSVDAKVVENAEVVIAASLPNAKEK